MVASKSYSNLKKILAKVRAPLTKHLSETKKHAAYVKNAIASLGGSHPIIQEGVSKLVNLAAGIIPTLAPDTAIKNAIAAFTSENMEISGYKALIETADRLGEKKIASTCRTILREEQAMAKALDAQLPGLIRTYLAELEDDREGDGLKTRSKTSMKKNMPARAAKSGARRPAKTKR